METFDFENQPQRRAMLESTAHDESGAVQRYDSERNVIVKQFPEIAEELAQEYETRRRVLEFDERHENPRRLGR